MDALSTASDSPLVSVVVPVYNGQRYLGEALDSIFAQSYRPLEVIVVDDGSTDGSEAVARSRPVHYLKCGHEGVSASRNAGIAAVQGELIAFLDADDLLLPDALSVQVGYLLAHPDAGFVVGRMRRIVEPGVVRPAWDRKRWAAGPIQSHLPVARRHLFVEIGGFDPSMDPCEDVDWIERASERGIHWEVLPDTVRLYRLHDSNATALGVPSMQAFKMLRAKLARRRAAAGEQPQGNS